jgi:hypothetical protein
MANQRREEVNAPVLDPARVRVGQAVGGVSVAGGASVGAAADNGEAGAAALASVARNFRGVSDQLGRWADETAGQEGRREGALAGFDPEFRPSNKNTIFAQAYDQAAVHTYKGQMLVKLDGQLAQAFDKHQDNPAGLAKAMASIREGWLGQIDLQLSPHVLPEFERAFGAQSLAYARQATRNQIARAKEQQSATLQDEIATRLKRVDHQAYQLGLDADADITLAGEVESLKARMRQRGADGRFLIDPATQARVLREAGEQVARSRVIGAFSRIEDQQGKLDFIERVKTEFKAGGNKVLEQFDVPAYERLVGHLTAQANTLSLAQQLAMRRATAGATAMQRAAEDGLELSPDATRQLQADIATSGGRPEHLQAVQRAQATLDVVRNLNKTPPDQIEAQLVAERARLTARGVDAAEWELDRLRLAEQYMQRQRGELVNGQLAVAAKAGIAKVAPLNLSSSDGFAATLANRIPEAEHVAQFYRREVQWFTPEERTELGVVGRRGGEPLVALARSIVAAGGERAPAILKEIAKDAPELAVLGKLQLEGGSPAAITDLARGLKLQRTDGYKKHLDLKGKETLEAIYAVVGDALRDMPEAQSTTRSAADALYEARAQQRQLTAFDADLYKRGIREILGEREVGGVVYGGVVTQSGWLSGSDGIILPTEVKQRSWREVVRIITPADLDAAGLGLPVGADGKPVALSRVKAARLVQYGSGAYVVATGDPNTRGQEGWVYRDRPGQPFVLDLNRLAPTLRARRPDLFLGGR